MKVLPVVSTLFRNQNGKEDYHLNSGQKVSLTHSSSETASILSLLKQQIAPLTENVESVSCKIPGDTRNPNRTSSVD